MSECDEVSQWSSEPSSEHVNRWSGLDGWKWTSHTNKNNNNKSLYESGVIKNVNISCVLLSAE